MSPALSRTRRLLAVLGTVVLPLTVPVGWAGAESSAASAASAADEEIEQTSACVNSVSVEPITTISAAQQRLAFTSAWALTRGAGVTVAVIDTGVTRHPLLGSRLRGGPDLLVPTDGSLLDCDGHGTLVAGIIAAAPDQASGFTGVAPDAEVLSIRQSSGRYELKDDERNTSRPAGDVVTMAEAVRRAVSGGAGVINISETSCVPAGTDAGDADLVLALAEAAAADVVVVAAAGNLGSACAAQNVQGSPPVTLPAPARVPSVLTVGAVDPAGDPAAFSLGGPWVDVAAPGTAIVSLDPSPNATGLVNTMVNGNSLVPIDGTSFAAPYVAGVAALVRSRFPDLTAQQVIDRITSTASHPAAPGGRNDVVGYGIIDPIAAVTAIIPGEPGVPAPPTSAVAGVLPDQQVAPVVDRSDRDTALRVSGLLLAALAVGGLAIVSVRRIRHRA